MFVVVHGSALRYTLLPTAVATLRATTERAIRRLPSIEVGKDTAAAAAQVENRAARRVASDLVQYDAAAADKSPVFILELEEAREQLGLQDKTVITGLW